MREIRVLLERIEEALKWRKEWQTEYGDGCDMASVRFWSDGSGVVYYKGQDLISFTNWEEFQVRAENLIEAKRYKTNIERVDWSSCA